MNMAELERHYQILAENLEAGRIDQAAFLTELDKLRFQDQWGRYWMIGSQTGVWYYFDGQTWHQADPGQADRLPYVDEQGRFWQKRADGGAWHCYQSQTGTGFASDRDDTTQPIPERLPQHPAARPELTQVYETRPALGPKPLLISGLVLMAMLVLLILPVGGSPSAGGPALAPSPRPTLGGGTSGGGGGGRSSDDGNGGGPRGAILGTVTDLSTGRPGAGIEVSVSGSIVRTDTNGSYSITGLPAGEYVVAPELQGQGTPAQGPLFVSLDGQNSVTVNLAYHSRPQPLPTDTPQPSAVAAATPPNDLPASGASTNPRPLIVAGLGMLLVLVGVGLHQSSHRPAPVANEP